MKNLIALLTRLLDALPQGRRLLGFSALAVVVLYWLARRSSRDSGRRSQPGRLGSNAGRVPRPEIAVKAGFHRVPAQHRVSLISNDAIFDGAELAAIDSAASSAAAALTLPPLRVLPSGLASVLELVRTCDVYIITQCSTDATEAAVRRALHEAGVFDAGQHADKVLFCETEVGRGAMARQLEPSLHIDSSAQVWVLFVVTFGRCEEWSLCCFSVYGVDSNAVGHQTVQGLAPFVPALLALRTPANVDHVERLAAAPHITAADDLSQYFILPQGNTHPPPPSAHE